MRWLVFLLLLLCSCRITSISVRMDTTMEYTIERQVKRNGKVKIDTLRRNRNYKQYEKDSTNINKFPACFYNDYCPEDDKLPSDPERFRW